MIHPHPDDISIQQYALQQENCSEDIVGHMAQCDDCQLKAASYALLFTALKKQEKPSFDFNLSALVMEQIPRPKPSPAADNSFVFLMALMAIGLLGIGGYLFKDIFVSSFPRLAPILTYLIITTVTSLLIFQGLDMYRKYQQQIKALNFY
jgi:hypothetical protein